MVIWLLMIVLGGTLSYLFYLLRQIRRINNQLTIRLRDHTRQPISVELINQDLNMLIANINRALQQEESTRLQSIREQKYYKEMIAHLSHDFRTPLTSIKGNQQLLQGTELDDAQREKLRIAQKHVDILEQMVATFFEYSYLTSHDTEIVLAEMDFSELLIEQVAGIYPAFEEKGLAIVMGEENPVNIKSDIEMVTRIIQNVLRNCYMYAKSIVEIELREEKEWVCLVVKNDFIPNQDLHLEHIFDRFYTGDRSRKKSTGLGLAIVRLLLEKVGGKAEATIENNRFVMTIYLKRS